MTPIIFLFCYVFIIAPFFFAYTKKRRKTKEKIKCLALYLSVHVTSRATPLVRSRTYTSVHISVFRICLVLSPPRTHMTLARLLEVLLPDPFLSLWLKDIPQACYPHIEYQVSRPISILTTSNLPPSRSHLLELHHSIQGSTFLYLSILHDADPCMMSLLLWNSCCPRGANSLIDVLNPLSSV